MKQYDYDQVFYDILIIKNKLLKLNKINRMYIAGANQGTALSKERENG